MHWNFLNQYINNNNGTINQISGNNNYIWKLIWKGCAAPFQIFRFGMQFSRSKRFVAGPPIVVTNTSTLDIVVHEILNGSNVTKLKRVAACSSERGLVSMIAGQRVVIHSPHLGVYPALVIRNRKILTWWFTFIIQVTLITIIHDHKRLCVRNDTNNYGKPFSYKSAKDVDDYFDRVEVERGTQVNP